MSNVVPINGARASERRVLPHNIETEASILGGVILRNDVLSSLDSLEVNDFYDPRHQIVWAAIRTLQTRNEPIDPVTLSAELERTGKLDAVGPALLASFELRVPTPDNVIAYAEIVRSKALARRLAREASDIVEDVYNEVDDGEELVALLKNRLERLERNYRDASQSLPIISVHQALEEIVRLSNTPVYATPFDGLNQALGFGGMLAGQIYYLAAGTGFGKTSLVAQVIRHHVSQGGDALIAFWEMFAGYYVARMAASVLRVHSNQILRCDVNMGHVAAAIPPGVEFLDSPSMALLERAIMAKVRRGRPAPLVVVDYIQLVGESLIATNPRLDARAANSQASAALREIAKRTGAVILVVSAASRASSAKLNSDVRKMKPRDLVSASKETGAIEYDGAGLIVLSLHDEMDGDENVATITVAKARFGEAQHLEARYQGSTGHWSELGRVVPTRSPAVSSLSSSDVARSAIMLALTKSGPIASKTKVYAVTGGTKTAVFEALDCLLAEGAIVRGEGGYQLPKTSATEAPIATTQTNLGGVS